MAEESDETNPTPVYWAGPWHFVQANIPADEMWCINRIPTRVQNTAIVMFMLTDDAKHFIEQGRAVDLGVWNSLQELEAAVTEHEAKVAAETAAEADKPRNGKKQRHRAEARVG